MIELRDPDSGREFTSEELTFIGSHLTDLRQGVADRRFRNLTLWTALAIGLLVHVAGYLLKGSATGEPAAALADLLYTLGFALWTGVVVVTIVEIIPEAKERQVTGYLNAYESALRARGRIKSRARDEERHGKKD